MNQFSIKIKFGDEIHRIGVSSHDISYDELRLLARGSIPAMSDDLFQVMWKDEEGDKIAVNCDDELIEALKVMKLHKAVPKFQLLRIPAEESRALSSSAAPDYATESILNKFSGPFPGALKDYSYTKDGRFSFDTLEEAAAAAMKCRKCRGITMEAATGKFTLRLRKLLKPEEVPGDLTWILNGQGVRMSPKKKHFKIVESEPKKDKLAAQLLRGAFPGYIEEAIVPKRGPAFFATLQEAAAAALHCKKCHGITRGATGEFTLRRRRKLIPSDAGELSWIIKRKGAFVRPRPWMFTEEKVSSATAAVAVRAEKDISPAFAVHLSGEDAHCVSSDPVDGPYPGYLEKYVCTADGVHSFPTLQQAIDAALTVDKCRGITREASGDFTLRKKLKMKPSAAGEMTWVMRTADVHLLGAKGNKGKGECNGKGKGKEEAAKLCKTKSI